MPLIVRGFDIETTGLITQFTGTGNKIFPQITAYAVVTWQDGRIVSHEARYFYPTIAVEPKAAEVSGFSVEVWAARGATRAMQAEDIHYLHGLFNNQTVCGHNVQGFDLLVLEAECKRLGVPAPQWDRRVIDTQVFAMPLVALGCIASASLDTVSRYLGIDPSNAHDPVWDAWRSVQIWERFVEKTADMFLSGSNS